MMKMQITGPVVLLIDNKRRDLDVASLVALHLGKLGIKCYLEPLEAFRAVLAAYRPSMIVFNHLTSSHLVSWSKRLAEIGVLTAVLPNEGIFYDAEDMRFSTGKYHRDAHIDYIFCWNEPHKRALSDAGLDRKTRIEAIGVPRFDFYFPPWAQLIRNQDFQNETRPKVLFCTNFVTARFAELPPAEGDRFFAPWVNRIPIYDDYRAAFQAHWRARIKAIEYLNALIAEDEFDIILRPHPNEDHGFYEKWIDSLSLAKRAHLRFEPDRNVSELILDCDIEISCETCTTALESWIAKKPTIELIFERHPLWYREIQAEANIECSDPARLGSLVREQLSLPISERLKQLRNEFLATWCNSPNGQSCLQMAQIIANALRTKKPANWVKLTSNDYRRAAKLKLTRNLGVAYHFDPLLWLKHRLWPERYANKVYVYRKSIEPSDVSKAKQRFEHLGAKILSSSEVK